MLEPHRLAACILLAATSAAAQAPPQQARPTKTPQPQEHQSPPACTNVPRAHAHPSASELLRRQQTAAADPSFLLAPEPIDNIGALRFRIRDYADCTGDIGCYWDDMQAQTARALDALETRAARRAPGERLAIVLDIDETTLTSYCEELREDFGYIPQQFEQWIVSDDAALPIPGTLRLYRRAQSLGMAVFFITGRPEAQRAATERNLRTAGFDGWTHLSLKQPADAGRTTEAYKSGERAGIVAQGYTLALNMGDQWNDLEGAPLAERNVKLPNPFYYLP